jgi:DNA-binding CsgD family transcriptional regulator
VALELARAAGTGRDGLGATDSADPLTQREREVAMLIAQGLTDALIGDRLRIAEGTAGVHVTHILAKLEFHSRAQIAAWAVERGLLSRSAS